ncbi:DNA internalization-related competence protein ComEC/Rec2 [Aquabacterium sp.]|uniref:DNA internalization-related competence protein ComEC/Rec2 n=1 Tax=Aquabacterium sp. TaxID=1872578 RepID=UPI0019983793|nr:DNA internalization-related competence protein ComEC/Rec2 [Aquabacterium sp.]MBC7702243.1 DNA internalization-related competence protein ComEC/Rec2 [Aquabacterium sp.]
MSLWTMAMAAWVVGVAFQLQQPSLVALAWAQGACASALLMVLISAWLMSRSRPGQRRAAWPLVWLACALLAWGSTTWRAHALMQQALPPSWQDQDLLLQGQVQGLPTLRGGSLGFDVAVHSLALQGKTLDQGMPSRVMLYWQAGESLSQVQAGQVWRWTVRLQPPVPTGNPGGFDAALWLLDKGVRATGSVRAKKGQQPQLLQSPSHWWSDGAVDRLRQGIREAIQRQVPDARLAGVLSGLTIGDQSGIGREDWDVFRKTSIAHLISISGLHIAMVGWMGSTVLAWLWRRSSRLMHHWPAPVVQLVSGVLVATAYSLLAGWGVPAQRTVCMMAVWALLRIGGRPWPWPPVWLAAAVVVTVMDPWALCQAGFWLSFVAVGVLMSSGTAVERPEPGDESWRMRGSIMVRSLVQTQWLTTLSLTPLAAVFFQQVSVVGFAANLLAIPVFTALITPLALGGVVWPALWGVAAWFVSMTVKVLAWMAHWSWASTHVPMLPMSLSVLVVLAAAALVLPVPWRWRLAGLPALLLLPFLPGPWSLVPPPVPGQFSVVAADVGQGTSVLVRTARHALVFDAGPKVGDQSDAGQRVVVPLLVALGVTQLDELIISHRDADHVGGAASIVREVPVTLLRSSLEDEHPLRQTMVGGEPLRHRRCEAGQHWQWDGVDFTVVHPRAEDYARRADLSPNALSCAVRIQAKTLPGREAASVFLAGDIEAQQEADVVARAQALGEQVAGLRSTVLVVPHHGSKTSSTDAFLQAVGPTQAVIQVGRRNGYGHPSPEVVARYDELGVARVATPACGAFLWNSSEAPLAQPQALKRDPAQRLRLGECWRQRSRHYWD